MVKRASIRSRGATFRELVAPSEAVYLDELMETRDAVEGLQAGYGKVAVLHGVDLTVGAGEVVALLGPNGAGKTTSFYMIVGLVRADAGTISISGQRVERKPIHQRSRLGV